MKKEIIQPKDPNKSITNHIPAIVDSIDTFRPEYAPPEDMIIEINRNNISITYAPGSHRTRHRRVTSDYSGIPRSSASITLPPEAKAKKKSKQYKQNTRRTQKEVTNLIYNNFHEGHTCLTLTFKPSSSFDITSIDSCNYAFGKYKQKLSYRFDNFAFVAVISVQRKRTDCPNAIHYHMVTNLEEEHAELAKRLWEKEYGTADVKTIYNLPGYCGYLCKNIVEFRNYTLANNLSTSIQRSKGFFASRNLQKTLRPKQDSVEFDIVIDELKNTNVDKLTLYLNPYNKQVHEKCTFNSPNSCVAESMPYISSATLRKPAKTAKPKETTS